MPRKVGPFPAFINGGDVQKITPADPAPTRPAAGGVNGKMNPGVSTYFGGPPAPVAFPDQQDVESATNMQEQN